MSTGNSIKGFFLALLLLLSLSDSQISSAADFTQQNVEQTAPLNQDGQTEIAYPDGSREVDYVQESETAREMTRAQKEKNAKEYDSFGGGITIISMCIVVGALAVLSILFMIFGKISSHFIKKKKKEVKSKKVVTEAADEEHAPDSGETIAAIVAALSQHFDRNHDMETTILTIQKLRKSYSPWNSKIYNMRHTPEPVHPQNPEIPKSKNNL